MLAEGATHRQYSLAGVTEIRIWTHGGNDNIDLSGTTINALVSGGAGNDVITGGAGNDVIYGGADDDAITGAAGYDFLIGGGGADRIVGSAGNDILVAGGVGCDQTLALLLAIAAEWNSSRASTVEEVEAIDDGIIETDTDVLTGSAGADWFILSMEDIITEAAKARSQQGDLVTYV